MATTRSYIKIESRFPQLTSRLDMALRLAVREAGLVGAGVAKAAAAERKRTGDMQASIKATSVRRGKRGLNVLVVAPVFYSGYQEYGTRGGRKRKLKAATLRRRESASGQARLARAGGLEGGIKPARFMAKGQRAARAALQAGIPRHMGRVR